ncbi:MAG: hypothetical protein K9H49_15970 [Bacteroidales bacterium]|nr:hypothetical protein [Bacteroidales bacterium]MCF8406192.1 hypothetical protein [Bacteroidales bacterium]
MSKGFKYFLLFTIIGIIFIFLYNPDYEKRCYKALEKEKMEEVIGVVVNKYHQKGNMYPNLEIMLSSDSSIIKKSFHAELSGIFDYVEIGDSIFKSLGSLVYTIKRDTVVTEMKYTKFCNK